jgi:hypothetical protein
MVIRGVLEEDIAACTNPCPRPLFQGTEENRSNMGLILLHGFFRIHIVHTILESILMTWEEEVGAEGH